MIMKLAHAINVSKPVLVVQTILLARHAKMAIIFLTPHVRNTVLNFIIRIMLPILVMHVKVLANHATLLLLIAYLV
jgi:hypothetical protein